MKFMKIEWLDSGREPQCAANPEYPDGQDIKAPPGVKMEKSSSEPAESGGYYLIQCSRCGCTTVATTAGRRDDPRCVEVPCRVNR